MAGRYTPETAKKNERYRAQYNKDNYDNIRIYRPKGDREKIKAIAASKGVSMNELINDLIDKYILN